MFTSVNGVPEQPLSQVLDLNIRLNPFCFRWSAYLRRLLHLAMLSTTNDVFPEKPEDYLNHEPEEVVDLALGKLE